MVTYSPGFGFFVGKQKVPGNLERPNMEAKSKYVGILRDFEPPISILPSSITTLPTGASLPGPISRNNKKQVWKRVAPCLAFLTAFSTAMALLLVWSKKTIERRQAFDKSMRSEYILDVSMDNPRLVQVIREIHLQSTKNHDLFNVNQTWEEEIISSILHNKANGVYMEYISRANATSTTLWLESHLNWTGIVVLTDSRVYTEALRSARNSKTRVLHAYLSTDNHTKEMTQPYDQEVRATKMGEGPNSIFEPNDSPTPRIMSFNLYSVLLAYNTTNLDYLSLDGQDIQDNQILDTIPWDKLNILILAIHWSTDHSDSQKKNLIAKLALLNYTLIDPGSNNKLLYYNNKLHKI